MVIEGIRSTVLRDGGTVFQVGGLTAFTVVLPGAVARASVGTGCVSITGRLHGDVSHLVAEVSLDATGRRLMVRLSSSPPDADEYTLSLTSELKMPSGQHFGGECDVRVCLLEGDVDGSGEVTAADIMAVRRAVADGSEYPWLDVDRSGAVTAADMRAVRMRLGRRIP